MANNKDKIIKIQTESGEKFIRFVKGKGADTGNDETYSFCQMNCKYSNCCENLPNPDKNTKGDSLFDFCISRDTTGKGPDSENNFCSYYPTDIEKYIPGFINKIADADPRFTLKDIHETICREFCSEWKESGFTDNCSKENPMCMLQALLLRKKTQEDNKND